MKKNNVNSSSSGVRIAVIYRVIFHYRVSILSKIAREWNLIVFHGKSVPKSKVVNAAPSYPFRTKKLFTICKRAKNNPLQILYFNPGLVFALMRWNPQIIIMEGSDNMLNNILIFLYCKLFSINYIWWGIGQVPGRKDSIYRKILTPARKFIIRRAVFCFAYCNLSAKYFRSITASHKVKVVPNSIDNEAIEREIKKITAEDKERLRKKLGISQDSVVLLFVGALEKNKRLNIFIEALRTLTEREFNVEGLIIGSGNAEAYYHEYSKRLNLGNIQFLGKIVKGVNIYFQIADIFVLPGRGGLAINQALINGLPVVCNTPADGTELDMIESGNNGILIESMDASKLAEALENMIENRRYLKMGPKALEVVNKTYNLNTMMDVIRRVIKEACFAELDEKKPKPGFGY